MSKLAQAIEIVTTGQTNGLDKKVILTEIQNTLGVSKGNASVYYFKARKSLESPKAETPVKAPKTEKVAKKAEIKPVDEAESQAYEAEMADRKANGFSSMSFTEWKEMSDSLSTLKEQFA